MRELLRKHSRFFLLAGAAAFALRLFFIWKFRFVAGDSFVYGDMAKNWLQHGTFAMTEDGVPVPTYIRLPGYPVFLAVIWRIAGMEHYTAVLVVQMFFDVGTCFLVAALARKVLAERAALAAFLLAALCPFTANYVATPLTETLAIFFSALTLWCAAEALDRLDSGAAGSAWWVACGAAVAAGLLLRPDAGILLAAIGACVLLRLSTSPSKSRIIAAALLLAMVSLAPLLPWTLRNWRVFHRFQPLAPRYANSPDEFVPTGFNRWVRTWSADYVSVDEIYWKVSGEPLDAQYLPARAADSDDERRRVEQLFAAYNQSCYPLCSMTPELDAQFAELAAERVRRAPLRYYLWLPALRAADMWLRPRTEALPLDSHWWRFRQDPQDATIAIALGALNLLLLLAALAGLLKRRARYAALFVLWVVLRSLFLATLENPEPRYTLECYPVVFVLAAANVKGNRSS